MEPSSGVPQWPLLQPWLWAQLRPDSVLSHLLLQTVFSLHAKVLLDEFLSPADKPKANVAL